MCDEVQRESKKPSSSHVSPVSDSSAPPSSMPPCTPERTLWYVERLFNYTNQLIERTQTRCNYLIFANSVAAVAFFTTTNAILSNRIQRDFLVSKSTALLLTLIPTSLFVCSLVVAVTAFLPKIYQYDIELNQDFITRMPSNKYREFVIRKTDESKVGDFIDEIHVLSRILNDKTRLVTVSARIFLLAIATIPLAIISMLI
jgi:hypothetical protein